MAGVWGMIPTHRSFCHGLSSDNPVAIRPALVLCAFTSVPLASDIPFPCFHLIHGWCVGNDTHASLLLHHLNLQRSQQCHQRSHITQHPWQASDPVARKILQVHILRAMPAIGSLAQPPHQHDHVPLLMRSTRLPHSKSSSTIKKWFSHPPAGPGVCCSLTGWSARP